MAAEGGPRGNYARGLVTREEIVGAARGLLVERGFYGVSLSLVAERSGLTTSGVQHHFDSKEELLQVVMESFFGKTIQWFSTQVRHDRAILDVIVELVERQTENSLDDAQLMTALSAASIDRRHPAHAWYRARYGILRSALTLRVRIDQERGLIRDDVDPDLLGAELLATVEGLLLQWLHEPDALDPVAIIQSYVSRLRSGYALAAELSVATQQGQA